MPRKVIRVNDGKGKKKKTIRPYILICIILVIAAIIATVIYELSYNKEMFGLSERNETSGPSIDTSNETEVFIIPDKQKIKLDVETASTQLQPNEITKNLPNTTIETDTISVSVPPEPETNFPANGNLPIPQSPETPTNLSTVFASASEYLQLLGTKWCGLGFTGEPDVVALEIFQEAHQCVSEHDDCAEVIRFGQVKHGLRNMDLCRRSHCSCDQQFYKCLENKHGLIFEVIGVAYFTILGSPCFAEDYPIVHCKKCTYTALSYKKRNRKRCLQYQFNVTQPKKYQWFDSPLYY